MVLYFVATHSKIEETPKKERTMTVYMVHSGEVHTVEANSPEQAEAIFMVAQGYESASDYDFVITEEDMNSVAWLETRTTVEEY